GGGGAVGMDGVAKARPDGYTLAATVRSTLTILPATQPDVTYKIADFAVIGSYAIDSGVILIKAGAPWKTLEEFVDHAKKNPGTVTYGSAGLGTNSYFNMELLQQAYGITLSHVPFNGSGPVKNALLGGHVPIGAAALSAVLSVVRSGDLVALPTRPGKRLPVIPSTPTLTEKRQPDASLSTWRELYAPARTPQPIADRLAAAFSLVCAALLLGPLRARDADAPPLPRLGWPKVVATMAALFIYALVLEPVGFVAATFVLLLFFFRALERQRWLVALGSSLA